MLKWSRLKIECITRNAPLVSLVPNLFVHVICAMAKMATFTAILAMLASMELLDTEVLDVENGQMLIPPRL